MRVVLFLLLFISALFAEVGKISAVVGDAKIVRDSKSIRVAIGTVLEKNDIIETQKNSKVQIIFQDSTIVTIGKNSALNINDYVYDPKTPKNSRTDLNFFKGAFKAITGNIGKINKEKFKLRTKSSTIGIRGTTIIGNQNNVGFISGSGVVTVAGVPVSVGTSEYTRTKQGEPPSNPEPMTEKVLAGFEEQLEPAKDADAPEDNEGDSDSEESSSSDDKDTEEESKESDEKTTEDKDENTSDESSDSDSNDENGGSENSSSSDSNDENSSSENSSSSDSSDGSATTSDAISDDGSLSGNDSTSDSASSDSTVASASLADSSGVADALNSASETANDAVQSDNDSTNSDTTPTEYTMTGFFLGANDSSSAGSGEEFIQKNTAFSAKRSNNVFSYTNQKLEKERITSAGTRETDKDPIVSASQSFSSFDTPGVGNYSGFPKNNRIGTISFNYSDFNEGNSTYNGSYTIYADNVGEVFVGLHGDNDNDNPSSSNFDEMFIVGTSGNTANMDNNKVYVYREFASVNVKYVPNGDGDFNGIDESKLKRYVTQSEKSYEYYNPKTDSLTHYNANNIFEKGASFVAGYKVEDGKDNNVVSYTSSILTYKSTDETSDDYGVFDSFDKHTFAKSDSSVDMLGTELQALAYSVNTDSYNDYKGTSSSVTNKNHMIGASFLEKDLMFTAEDLDSTGYTIKGFNSALIVTKDPTATPNVSVSLVNDTTLDNTKVEFKKESDGYKLKGLIKQGSNLELNLEDSEIRDNTAYFIGEDMFGLRQDSQDGSYSGFGDLIENTGFMVSVHDGGLENDNPKFLDDDSSWGYWTATYKESDKYAYVDTHSTWVAGIIDTSAISSLLNGATKQYTFEGQVLGNVIKGSTVEQIFVNDKNIAKFTFNFGSGTYNNMSSGSLEFDTKNTSWKLNVKTDPYVSIDTTTVGGNPSVSNPVTGAFSGDFLTGGSSTVTVGGNATNVTSGDIKGQLYGSGSIKSLGGVFDATDGTYTAKGVFKATKK